MTWHFIAFHMIAVLSVGGDYLEAWDYQYTYTIFVFLAIPIWAFVIPAPFLKIRCSLNAEDHQTIKKRVSTAHDTGHVRI